MKLGGNSTLALLATFAVLMSWHEAAAEIILVPFGPETQWKYLDDGSDQSAAWRSATYDDNAWQSGPAPLGYGDPEVETSVSFGQDPRQKRITTYFRHRFRTGTTDDCRQLVFRIRSDDGIVVYLNGKEVVRNNLPVGETTGHTTAMKALNDLDERLYRRFQVSGEHLSPGENIVAVEIHQAAPASTDLFLDLDLRGYGAEEDFRPIVTAKARPQTEAFLKEHHVPQGRRIIDGYMDGGRNSALDADGLLASGREVILVDRSRDELLQRHLAFAGSEPLKALAPLDRGTILAAYVDTVMNHTGGRQWCEPADRLLVAEYHGRPVLLGDVPRLCGSGVCRHRALLYKLLADEAGLAVALVRGGVATQRNRAPHAWNELYLDDGTRLIVDGMTLPEIRFPNHQSSVAGRYLDVENSSVYARPD